MKKTLILISPLILSSIAEAGNIYLRAGMDIKPSYKKINISDGYITTEKEGKGISGELALEYTFDVTKNLELGVGIAAQKHGELTTVIDWKEASEYRKEEIITATVPIYITSKYNFKKFENDTKLYAKADIGYFGIGKNKRLYEYNKSKGYERSEKAYIDYRYTTYAGIGLGIEYNNFLFDVMYKYNTMKFEAEGSRTVAGKTTKLSVKPNLNYGRITASIGYKF